MIKATRIVLCGDSRICYWLRGEKESDYDDAFPFLPFY